jgi:tetratricopeptide (TPR) repeat protein
MRVTAIASALLLGITFLSPHSCYANERLDEARTRTEDGKYDDAKTILEDLLEEDKENPEAFFELGKVWYFLGDYKKATKNIEKAIDIQADSAK